MGGPYVYEIEYGKARVPVYRVHAAPLVGVPPIPESAFTGRPNTILAAEIDVDVLGKDFLPAYTEGDNRLIVATDSMKNFILRESLAYGGATLEGLLAFLGERFVATYAQLRTLRLTARELPFVAATVPGDGGGFGPSPVLFDRVEGEHAFATLNLSGDGDGDGDGGGVTVTGHRCGLVGLRLLKTTGSAFTAFVRDDYTTLPERRDRPLFVQMDVHWRYADATDLLAPGAARYVPAEQVRDVVRAVFNGFVSESIQHLVHAMGQRLLDRFPQLVEVVFDARNLTRDPIAANAEDDTAKVYTDPFPAFGVIRLRMERAG